MISDSVSSIKFKVMYYTYIFEYDSEINLNYLKLYNQLNQEHSMIIINKINEDEYIKASKYIDRKKILLKDYEQTIQVGPNYTYAIGKDFSPIKKIWFNKKDELGQLKFGINWLLNNIKHNPKDNYMMHESAVNLFYKAKKTDKRLNCRNLAVILNAIYLSMSLKSRYIICFQKEDKIDDCHFVVEVYINKWNKWILIDSSYGLLFKNQKHMYLSLEEVRNLIANDSFIEIKTVNSKINIELYWRNFVKKLYRFQRPIESSDFYDEFDQFVDLVPCVRDYTKNSNSFVMDNPHLFWRE